MTTYSKKIVIVGGFGWRDIGDEAMPEAVIANLRKAVPGVDIVMLSPNPEYTTSYHRERSIKDVSRYLNRRPWLLGMLANRRLGIVGEIVDRFVLRGLLYWGRWLYFFGAAALRRCGIYLPMQKDGLNIIDELFTSDLLYNNGGGNINSLLPAELAKQTLMMFTASVLGKPIIISGQTIGPLRITFHKWLVKRALNKADILTFRDKGVSMDRVKEIGVTRPTLIDTADDAVTIPNLPWEEIEHLIQQNGGHQWLRIDAPVIVALNLNGYLRAMGKSRIDEFRPEVELMARVADKLVEHNNAKLLLVPTDYGPSADDRVLLKWLASTMKISARALIIKHEHRAAELKGLVSIAAIAIGARYHFCVFAMSSGVPCICLANGVYQKTKLKGLMELYNMPYYFIDEDMEKVDFEILQDVAERVLQNRIEISKLLKERTIEIQDRSLATIRRTAAILSGRK